MIDKTFTSTVHPPDDYAGPAHFFIFRGSELLVREVGEQAEIPCLTEVSELELTPLRQQYLGYYDSRSGRIHCFSAEVDAETDAPPGMAFCGLRQLYQRLAEQWFWLAGRAVQIVNWDRSHLFCSRCGSVTQTDPNERAKVCPQCGFTTYPRLAPAIIIAITRRTDEGREILLARNGRWQRGWYSVIAGFVEPGETLEECARREVKEEVGIDIDSIRYFGSQPWPFPNSLMIGFTAEYAGGEIVLEEEEIEDARWFRADDLPLIPSRLSISRQMIDWFVQRNS